MENYFLKKDTTNMIKGLCIISIIIHHLVSHIITINPVVTKAFGIIAPIAVAFFLFMSGYGNTLSIFKKFSFKKLFWLVFRIYMTFLFVYIVYLLGVKTFSISYLTPPNFSKLISSFLELTVYPHNVWYLKAQVIAYLTLFISYFFTKKYFNIFIWIFWIIEIPVTIAMHLQGAWYVSALAFPLGCTIAVYKDCVSEIVNKFNLKIINAVLFTINGIFFIVTLITHNVVVRVFSLNCLSIFVCLWLSGISYNHLFKNLILAYIGKISLELYIIHVLCIYIFEHGQSENAYIASISGGGYCLMVLLIAFSAAPLLHNVCNKFINKLKERFD